MRILVLNGPNLALVGRREPHLYGRTTLAEINSKLEALAAELHAELSFVTSNHEGDLVDALHKSIDNTDGALINPGGLTQHGVSLHDAIKAMPFPVVEVHLSNIAKREPFRHHSYVSPVAEGTIAGLGWRGYLLALRWLVDSRQ
jgi:3-dehydroquinate dehydratase-2